MAEQPSLKARLRRLARRRAKQVEKLGHQAESQLELNFVRRLGHLAMVRRFVTLWLLVGVLLIAAVIAETRALTGYYQTLQPAPGGIYSEGIVGVFTNANPLYATDRVNNAVSKLIFASLFKYDSKGKLIGDLAESWKADKTGMTYTVTLRPNLIWQDGARLTADDVVYTYQTIQNPDAQSPLNVSWQHINISASDARTVQFKLPNPLASFPDSLTTGIVPKHILQNVDYAHLRSVSFNTTKPVGSGPFELKKIEVEGNSPATREEEIALEPFAGYHGGAAKLSNFVVHAFPNDERMLKSFRNQNITAMAGLSNVPTDIVKAKGVHSYNLPLAAANMVFFKNSVGVMSDKSVRQALVGGVDTDQILTQLGGGLVPVREPILQGQLGYDPTLTQLRMNTASAGTLLDKAGWRMGPNGIRMDKRGRPLTFRLYAQNTAEYRIVTDSLKRQWKALGADVQVYLQNTTELQLTVTSRTYDALLYGISIGADPDVFAYWDSSQANVLSASRLNFSEYKSAAADAALAAGRIRSEPALRAVKYKNFLKAWRADAPALGLYQPKLTYITHGKVYGLENKMLPTDTDRFDNVADWMIRTVKKDKE